MNMNTSINIKKIKKINPKLLRGKDLSVFFYKKGVFTLEL